MSNSAESDKMFISPNMPVSINCNKRIDYISTCAIVQQSKKLCLPLNLEVTLTVIQYGYRIQELRVRLSNLTSHAEVFLEAIVGNIQPFEIDKRVFEKMERKLSDIFDKVNKDIDIK